MALARRLLLSPAMTHAAVTLLLVLETGAEDRWGPELERTGFPLVRCSFEVAATTRASPRPLAIVTPEVVERLHDPVESLRRLFRRADLLVVVAPSRFLLGAHLAAAGFATVVGDSEPLAPVIRGLFGQRTHRGAE